MCDPNQVELAAKVTGEAVEKILESESINNLLAPVTKELGLTIGEVANVLRFYVTENLKSVCCYSPQPSAEWTVSPQKKSV
jgi:hypothetical protein